MSAETLDYELVPLLPQYLEASIKLYGLQFSKDNTISSPVYVGLKQTQDKLVEDARIWMKSLINSPYCMLMINKKNGDIMAIYTCESHDWKCSNSNNTSQGIENKEKKKMDQYIVSKISSPKYIELYKKVNSNTDNIRNKINFDGHFCAHPKYLNQGVLNLMVFYIFHPKIKRGILYDFGDAANEYSYKAMITFYGPSLEVAIKISYSELFDYLGLEYTNEERNRLNLAIKEHPYRYHGVVDCNHYFISRKVDKFFQNPIHRDKMHNFYKLRRQFEQSRL